MDKQREAFEAFKLRGNSKYKPHDDSISDRHDWVVWQAAQAAQPAQPGWLPIKSAPKDGTVILGYRNGRIGTASIVPRDDCEMWTFCGTSAWVEIHPTVKPTHWMPLPAAPSTKEGE